MNNQFDNLMYEAGLTAQGCWDEMDEYDRTAILKFAQLIVHECLEQIDKVRNGCEADNEDQQALGADWAGLAVARHFGIE